MLDNEYKTAGMKTGWKERRKQDSSQGLPFPPPMTIQRNQLKPSSPCHFKCLEEQHWLYAPFPPLKPSQAPLSCSFKTLHNLVQSCLSISHCPQQPEGLSVPQLAACPSTRMPSPLLHQKPAWPSEAPSSTNLLVSWNKSLCLQFPHP